jgi:hypothetical protein
MTPSIDKIFFSNIPLVFLVLTILITLLFKNNKVSKFCNLLFFLPIGLGGIWNFASFFLQMYDKHANSLFIINSFFDAHVAIAYLSFGISGIIASLSNLVYKLSVSIIITIFLCGMAINQFVVIHNMHEMFYRYLDFGVLYNILIPIFIWISLLLVYLSPQNSNNSLKPY